MQSQCTAAISGQHCMRSRHLVVEEHSVTLEHHVRVSNDGNALGCSLLTVFLPPLVPLLPSRNSARISITSAIVLNIKPA